MPETSLPPKTGLTDEENTRLAAGSFLVFILAHVLLLLAIMAAGRLAMVRAFAEPGLLAGREADLWAMWRTGLLFDLRTATIGLSPMYVLGLAACFFGPAARVCSALQKIYSPVLFFAAALAAVTNFYYYQTFHNEIDIFIFGLINDDTRAIMASVINDYPIVRVILSLAAVTCLGSHITRSAWRAGRRPGPPSGLSPALGIVAAILFTAVYFLGLRGSIGTFPLRQNDAMVSDIPLLNKAVPNGLMALKWAHANYRAGVAYQPVPLARGRELALAAIGREGLTDRTAENTWLAGNPPHVVLVVMESFGSNMLEFDREGSVDLLGSLRRHLEEDFLFKRFLPEDNGTMPSLVSLLFSCPDASVTLSEAKTKRLEGSAFEIFKEKGGYETVFIYPGRGSWRNIGAYLAAQGSVDGICDQNCIVSKLKDEKPGLASEAGTWGLPDEYAFDAALRLLETSSKPMFIVILTVTNHPPYVPPPHYRPFPISPGEELMTRLDVAESAKLKLLQAYQYANSSLGDFAAAVKGGPLGERTIIAATGDHQMRSVKADHPAELLLDTAVPFYLYVPKPILEHTPHLYAPERPGSHKDIPPTLYALSLSGAPYYSVGGRNLLAERDDPALAFGFNTRLFIDPEGVSPVDEALNRRYAYGEGLRLGNPGPVPSALAEKIRAFGELRRWQINARAAGTD